jgi:hypothetical protein
VKATTTKFYVEPDHKRTAAMTNLASTWEEVQNLNSESLALRLLGAEYTIDGLSAGNRYYVRVFAENSAKGCGEAIVTYPESEVPRKAPDSPGKVSVTVADKTSLNANWFVPNVDGDFVRSYRVEVMTKSTFASKSNSFFGVQEIQVLSSTSNRTYTRKHTDYNRRNITAGSFKLAFGDMTVALPGTVEAVNGRSYLITTADLTAQVARGDSISVGGYEYTVHMTNTFNSTYLPLAVKAVDEYDASAGSGQERNYEGERSLGLTIYRQDHTDHIPWDATEVELEEALENMASIGQVYVTRTLEGAGYEWTITWLTDVGDQPTLVVNDLFH